jgi:hypothetical protein
MRVTAAIGMAFAALLGGTAFAATPAQPPPDPASIVLPDMSPTRDPKVIEDGWKHYYFHKSGVGYVEAYADFSECYRYLPVAGADPNLPMFAPWTETPGVVRIQPVNPYGLVGMGIAALISGPIERRARQAPLRRCLETRGYVRYPLAESVWRELMDDYSPRSIALQAKAATLPAPDLAPVTK